jgi:long-chain acyl-CoA synthetase
VNQDTDQRNLNQVVLVAMDAYAGRVCFRVESETGYRKITYRELSDLTFRVAGYLCREGLAPGDRVVIVAENSAEWMASFLGCLMAGGVAVPLRGSLPPDEICRMMGEAGARVAVIQEPELLRRLERAGLGASEPASVLLVDDTPKPDLALARAADARDDLEVTSFADLRSTPLPMGERDRIRREADELSGDALAAIHFTTARGPGNPLGVVFDHRRRLEAMRQLGDWLTLGRDEVPITVLPWSYPPSLLLSLRYLLSGVSNVLTASQPELPDERRAAEARVFENLRHTSPTSGLATPFAFERLLSRVTAGIDHLPGHRREVFHWALRIGREYRAAGPAASRELRDGWTSADRTIFSQIRADLGGRLRRIYSVGAPLPPHLVEFLEVIGLEPITLYALTEAGGFPALGRSRLGTCGGVAPGFQIRIADDGEVLVRSRSVMCGYWQRPDETREVLDPEGWLRTGDLGRFDGDGELCLTGHKQSRFVLSTGRAIMPTTIEFALASSTLVSQAVVFGAGRPYATALVVPDWKAVARRLQEDAGEAPEGELSAADPQVIELLEGVREEFNRHLDGWKRIQRWTLLDRPLTEAAGELAASMTPNRTVVSERYAAEIEAMYPARKRPAETEVTHIPLKLDELRELYEKQDILDAWLEDAGIGFLFDLARDQGIHPSSMVHICETVAAIAQMQSEERPLSTALIVGDPARIARILPESQIQLHRYDHIRRMRGVVVSLAEMVDGLVLGYVLDQHGYVRGIHHLGVELDDEVSYLLGPRFRHHAAIARHCEAVVFFVPPGGRQARVFAAGQLVGRYANGNWSSESVDQVDRTLARLAEDEAYDISLLQRLLRCAFRMSEANHGAIFMVGDADLILAHSDPPLISAFATIVTADLGRLSDTELINFARQDGATVIDAGGRFRGAKVLLRPAPETRAEIGPGKGARHSSAAKMSAEAECLAITVSQDGPISAYCRGKLILSL